MVEEDQDVDIETVSVIPSATSLLLIYAHCSLMHCPLGKIADGAADPYTTTEDGGANVLLQNLFVSHYSD